MTDRENPLSAENCNRRMAAQSQGESPKPALRWTAGPWRVECVFPDLAQRHTFEPRVWLMADDPEYGEVRIADIPDVASPDSEEMAMKVSDR